MLRWGGAGLVPIALCSNLNSVWVLENGTILQNTPRWEKMASRNGYVTKTYLWNDAYLAALFESDRKKMPARLQAAESAVNERLHALSADHGGIPHERQALEDATNGLKVLRQELSEWQSRQSSASAQRRDSTSSQPASEPDQSNEGADNCKSCKSENQTAFPSEINIHFPGNRDLTMPTVLAFPTLLVCLDCGFTKFVTAETELRVLKEETAQSRTA